MAEFIFPNVAYRATVYRTGGVSITMWENCQEIHLGHFKIKNSLLKSTFASLYSTLVLYWIRFSFFSNIIHCLAIISKHAWKWLHKLTVVSKVVWKSEKFSLAKSGFLRICSARSLKQKKTSPNHPLLSLTTLCLSAKPVHCTGQAACWAGTARPPPSRGSWQFKSLSSWAKAKTFRRPRKQRACDLTSFFCFNTTRIQQDIFWRKGVRDFALCCFDRIFKKKLKFFDFHSLVLQKKRLAALSAFFQRVERPIKALHCWSLLLCSCCLVIQYSLSELDVRMLRAKKI